MASYSSFLEGAIGHMAKCWASTPWHRTSSQNTSLPPCSEANLCDCLPCPASKLHTQKRPSLGEGRGHCGSYHLGPFHFTCLPPGCTPGVRCPAQGVRNPSPLPTLPCMGELPPAPRSSFPQHAGKWEAVKNFIEQAVPCQLGSQGPVT